MYNGMQLYRGVVSYADGTTTYVLIPSFTGGDLPMKISDIMGMPNVEVGDQVIVAVEDSKAYNIHIVYTQPKQVALTIDGGSA